MRKSKNIPVLNVPVYGSDTVAEMAFAHILQVARDIGNKFERCEPISGLDKKH